MPNIAEDLQKIMEARYGKDVRQSIHDAIYDINNVCDSNVGTVTALTTRAENAANSAEGDALTASAKALVSEGYAVGTQNGTPVSSGSPYYQNNAAYYSGEADASAEDSEAWAVGTRGGVPVGSTDPAYNNNSKYWKDQAQSIVGDKVDSFNGRTGVVMPTSGDYGADDITFDNTGTELNATDVQAGISELSSVKSNRLDMTRRIATGSTNTTGATITAGEFFYLNGSYCRALADIANNASFTLNTNYKVTNVGDELSIIHSLPISLGTKVATTGTYTNACTYGNVVQIAGYLKAGENINANEVLIKELPPSKLEAYFVVEAPNQTFMNVYIPANGTEIRTARAMTAGDILAFNIVYMRR